MMSQRRQSGGKSIPIGNAYGLSNSTPSFDSERKPGPLLLGDDETDIDPDDGYIMRRKRPEVMCRRRAARVLTLNGTLTKAWLTIDSAADGAPKFLFALIWLPFLQKAFAGSVGGDHWVDGTLWDLFWVSLWISLGAVALMLAVKIDDWLYALRFDHYRSMNRGQFRKIIAQSTDPYQDSYDNEYHSDEDPEEASTYLLWRGVTEDYQCFRWDRFWLREPLEDLPRYVHSVRENAKGEPVDVWTKVIMKYPTRRSRKVHFAYAHHKDVPPSSTHIKTT